MLLDLRSLQEAHDLVASGAALSGGNADLALLETITASGGAAASGSASLPLLLAIAATGAAGSTGAGSLALVLALGASGSGSSGGAAVLAALLALAASGGAVEGGAGSFGGPTTWTLSSGAGGRVDGAAELQTWTFGVLTVAVLVPRTNGSYALRSVITGIAYEYPVSPVDSGGGLVQIPPDELARFLRAVPGSLVQDPLQAEVFRLLRPFVPQPAGPFRGE